MAPTMVPCGICGLAFTSGSLRFHEKACARKHHAAAPGLASPAASAIAAHGEDAGCASSRASSTDWGLDDGKDGGGEEVGLAPLFDHSVCENEFDAVLFPSDQPAPRAALLAGDAEVEPLSPSLSPPPYAHREKEECMDQPHPPAYSPGSLPNYSTLAAQSTTLAPSLSGDTSCVSTAPHPRQATSATYDSDSPLAKCVLVDGELAPILPAVWVGQGGEAAPAPAPTAAVEPVVWVPPTPHPSSAASRSQSRSEPRGVSRSAASRVSPSPVRRGGSASPTDAASSVATDPVQSAPRSRSRRAVSSSLSTSPQASTSPQSQSPRPTLPHRMGAQQQRLAKRRVELQRKASKSPPAARVASASSSSATVRRKSSTPATSPRRRRASLSPTAVSVPTRSVRVPAPRLATPPRRGPQQTAARRAAPSPHDAVPEPHPQLVYPTPCEESFLASPQPNQPLACRPTDCAPSARQAADGAVVRRAAASLQDTPESMWNTPALLRFDTPSADAPELAARGSSEMSTRSTQPPSPGPHGAGMRDASASAASRTSGRGVLQPRSVNTVRGSTARKKEAPMPRRDGGDAVWCTPPACGTPVAEAATVVRNHSSGDAAPPSARELQLLARHREEVAALIASQEERLAREQAVFRAELEGFVATGGGEEAVLRRRLDAAEEEVAALKQTCRNLEQERSSLRNTKKAFAAELAQCKDELAHYKREGGAVSPEAHKLLQKELAAAQQEAARMKGEAARERTRGERLQALLKSRGQQQQVSVEKLTQECERRGRQQDEEAARLQEQAQEYGAMRDEQQRMQRELDERAVLLEEQWDELRRRHEQVEHEAQKASALQGHVAAQQEAVNERGRALDVQERELSESAEQQMVEKQRLTRERERLDAQQKALARREQPSTKPRAASDSPQIVSHTAYARQPSLDAGALGGRAPAAPRSAPSTPAAGRTASRSFLERDAPEVVRGKEGAPGRGSSTPKNARASDYEHKRLTPTPTKAAPRDGWELRDGGSAYSSNGSVLVQQTHSRPSSRPPSAEPPVAGWELHDPAEGLLLGGARAAASRRKPPPPQVSQAPPLAVTAGTHQALQTRPQHTQERPQSAQATAATQQAHQARPRIPSPAPPAVGQLQAQLSHPSLSYHTRPAAPPAPVHAPARDDGGVFAQLRRNVTVPVASVHLDVAQRRV